MDEYAQDVRKLFRQAYVGVLAGGTNRDVWGRMLANQFVAGLGMELKYKVVGQEGNLDQVLLKDRFEEAKRKELACQRSAPFVKRLPPGGTKVNQTRHSSVQPGITKTYGTGLEHDGNRPAQGSANKPQKRKCFNCGIEGHMVRECPYPK